ncbi:50S ribosomal protein L9 [Candidatus Omnitrophota bacterium]
MKIILRKDIKKLGEVGVILTVKDGYARNYLIPGGLALEATKSNLQQVEVDKQRKVRVQEKEKEALRKLAEQVTGTSCTVTAQANEEEQLYGSISTADIAAALKTEKGVEIDEKCFQLPEPIKALGIYEVDVVLHPEVTTKIRVWVTKS